MTQHHHASRRDSNPHHTLQAVDFGRSTGLVTLVACILIFAALGCTKDRAPRPAATQAHGLTAKLTEAEQEEVRAIASRDALSTDDTARYLAPEAKPQLQLAALAVLSRSDVDGEDPLIALLHAGDVAYAVRINAARVLVGRDSEAGRAAVAKRFEQANAREKDDLLTLAGAYGGDDDMPFLDAIIRSGDTTFAPKALAAKNQMLARLGR